MRKTRRTLSLCRAQRGISGGSAICVGSAVVSRSPGGAVKRLFHRRSLAPLGVNRRFSRLAEPLVYAEHSEASLVVQQSALAVRWSHAPLGAPLSGFFTGDPSLRSG